MALATAKALGDLLTAAVVAGELVSDTDTASLSRTVQAILGGSLLLWALYREGTARDWVLADLEAVLRPYLRAAAGTAKLPPSAGGETGWAFGKAQNAQLELGSVRTSCA